MVTQLNCPRKSDKSPLLIKQKCKEYIMNYCPNCNARTTIAHLITPAMLREAKEDERLDTLIHPFDEIDIPLDTGGTVTVVCGHVTGSGARFIFKDCWNEGVMNEEATNKGGYFKSRAASMFWKTSGPILPRSGRTSSCPGLWRRSSTEKRWSTKILCGSPPQRMCSARPMAGGGTRRKTASSSRSSSVSVTG